MIYFYSDYDKADKYEVLKNKILITNIIEFIPCAIAILHVNDDIYEDKKIGIQLCHSGINFIKEVISGTENKIQNKSK